MNAFELVAAERKRQLVLWGISQEITHSSGCPYSVRSTASFAKQSTRSASKTERIRSAAEPTALNEKNQCSVLDGQVSAFDGR